MTQSSSTAPADFLSQWQQWHHERIAAVTAAVGPATLVGTHWLTDQAQFIEQTTGRWRTHAGALELLADDGSPLLSLAPGQQIERDGFTLRHFQRDDVSALRIFDPAEVERQRLEGVETFEPSIAWRFQAQFVPDVTEIEVEQVDGYTTRAQSAGEVVFSHGGTEYRLLARGGPAGLNIVFSDTNPDAGTYRFRFLGVRVDGHNAELDFNRAHLPPCAFSDHWVCPIPPPQNRLPFAVAAGEIRPHLHT